MIGETLPLSQHQLISGAECTVITSRCAAWARIGRVGRWAGSTRWERRRTWTR